ncbi:SDR family NAD(P)-dependent oxidoreductase [Reinekea sp. G2M2-21]|uniref:SDR family NAD(P)-dependent oxidoreductase n=1 Tax=Reinekea sp. G2M2-21 TaxID=2788942 RepID=UPI0018A91FB7|nr:SDR family NAD(P)-dependent oxidoreductase [Reinekea sp. G2M2-21]
MKTAVITGASTGIGEACARTLAASGWQVVLVARRAERIAKIADELQGLALPLDVTNVTKDDFEAVEQCDLLINCAGGALGLDQVDSYSAEDWSTMFDRNVIGTLKMTQALLPRIIEAQGCIINITSTAALGGYEGGSGYCAAKSAQRALTQSLRLEMKGKPIRITEVLPGMVYTPEFSLNRFNGDEAKAKAVYEGVDRPLTGEDVAEVVASIAHLPPHVNIDEIVVRPVAQRGQYALHRGELGWHEK